MTSLAGAVILADRKKTVLFKNRDVLNTEQCDTLFYDVDCFGIRGVDKATQKESGLTVGVNRHGLAVASTHVHKTVDPNYDLLAEQIVMFAKDAEDGLKMTRSYLKGGRKYQWGNLILADHDSILVIEIAGSNHSIERSERKALRTSHHVMLDTEDTLRQSLAKSGEYTYENSVNRLYRGYELVKEVSRVDGVFDMLKDHGDNPSSESMCVHGENGEVPETRRSYVIEVNHGKDAKRPSVLFHVAKGRPCENEFMAIPLVFPADEQVMERARSMYFE
ncbi:MAG: hypothetical protein GF309_00495 [Candidatus Lokiarchaeota archaeon]|nr:hypothetical protein [Candidatus Lokiarchaeota archaeon]